MFKPGPLGPSRPGVGSEPQLPSARRLGDDPMMLIRNNNIFEAKTNRARVSKPDQIQVTDAGVCVRQIVFNARNNDRTDVIDTDRAAQQTYKYNDQYKDRRACRNPTRALPDNVYIFLHLSLDLEG